MMPEIIRKGEVLVIGMARSGLATVRFLLYLGAEKIVVNDNRQLSELEREAVLLGENPAISLVTGAHPSELVTGRTTLVVKSPGVPPYLDILKKAESLKIPIISEVELAYHFIKAPIIGITGTNGKTTTTMLASEIFKRGNRHRVLTAGNIGIPICDVAKEAGAGDVIIAELSSFQLDNIIKFRPFISVIINISEDHLDYHTDRESYIKAKQNILVNQVSSDVAVLNADDPEIFMLKDITAARTFFFSRKKMVEGFCINGGDVGLCRSGHFEPVCPVNGLALPGEHNIENILAASTAAWAGGIDLKTIAGVLRDFKGVEHRLEVVRIINGVTFINDSKGTNPEASVKALEAFPDNDKILIAGGKDKGADFKELVNSFSNNKVKSVILLGETAKKIEETSEKTGFKKVHTVKTIEDAVTLAWEASCPGDIVLLSPACASWDMFQNYEERGRSFKEKVNAL